MFSNPNGECFDKDGIPERSVDMLFGNHPIKDYLTD